MIDDLPKEDIISWASRAVDYQELCFNFAAACETGIAAFRSALLLIKAGSCSSVCFVYMP